MAVSIDTRTALVRFIGWLWEDTCERVWVPLGFWKPLPEPVETYTLGAGVGFYGCGYGLPWNTPGLPVTIPKPSEQLLSCVIHCERLVKIVQYIPMISPCLLLNVANRELVPEQLEKTKTQELEQDPKENQYQRTGGNRYRWTAELGNHIGSLSEFELTCTMTTVYVLHGHPSCPSGGQVPMTISKVTCMNSACSGGLSVEFRPAGVGSWFASAVVVPGADTTGIAFIALVPPPGQWANRSKGKNIHRKLGIGVWLGSGGSGPCVQEPNHHKDGCPQYTSIGTQ